MDLRRYKDTMMTVEMQYGQNTTRWRSTRKRGVDAGGGAEDGGGAVVVGLPVERISPGQVNMWMK